MERFKCSELVLNRFNVFEKLIEVGASGRRRVTCHLDVVLKTRRRRSFLAAETREGSGKQIVHDSCVAIVKVSDSDLDLVAKQMKITKL